MQILAFTITSSSACEDNPTIHHQPLDIVTLWGTAISLAQTGLRSASLLRNTSPVSAFCDRCLLCA
jgi:hypothetical protein